jgi:micrococcal nuclease
VSRLPLLVLAGLAGAVVGCLCALVAVGAILLWGGRPWEGAPAPVTTPEATGPAGRFASPAPAASATQQATPTGELSSPVPATPTWSPSPTYTWTATLAPSPTPSPEGQSPATAPSPDMSLARVLNVVDGDTIEVEIAGQRYSLRYIGIDCPEPEQPGWWEAMEANRQLVEGQTVRLERDVSETDQYGRLLRYVYVGDLLVNAELVRRGYAVAVTFPPDVAHADLFAQLQAEALQEGRGLWASTPVTRQGGTWNCVGNLYNCDDFSSCEEVMSYWETCPGDPSRLDGDHDGRPCESLCR